MPCCLCSQKELREASSRERELNKSLRECDDKMHNLLLEVKKRDRAVADMESSYTDLSRKLKVLQRLFPWQLSL